MRRGSEHIHGSNLAAATNNWRKQQTMLFVEVKKQRKDGESPIQTMIIQYAEQSLSIDKLKILEVGDK